MHKLFAVGEGHAVDVERLLERVLDELARSREEVRELREDLRSTQWAIVAGLCVGVLVVSVLH